MFKFGFSSSEEDANKSEDDLLKVKKPEITWKESREIKFNELKNVQEFIEDCDINSVQLEDFNIKYVSSIDVVLKLIKNNDDEESDIILKAEENHSDLLTGVYEGGLKIWECTYDLLRFMEKNDLNMKEKRVLDLGCGAGLIGILSLMKEATCYFQDYNEEVLLNITIPNIAINSEHCGKDSLEKCKYFSGDWLSFMKLLHTENLEETEKFDYIFTCETIYNPENYKKLHEVLQNLLKVDGVIYLAAKSYYFGVGGGLSEFKDFIQNEKVFEYKTVWKHSDGLEREILEIKLIK